MPLNVVGSFLELSGPLFRQTPPLDFEYDTYPASRVRIFSTSDGAPGMARNKRKTVQQRFGCVERQSRQRVSCPRSATNLSTTAIRFSRGGVGNDPT